MFWVLLLVRCPSEKSSEVFPGHKGSQAVFDKNSLQTEDREAKLAPLCLSRQDTSTDMHSNVMDLSLYLFL